MKQRGMRCAVCGCAIKEARHGWVHVGREPHPAHWPQPSSLA